MHALRGTSGDDAGQVVALADRLDLGRAGGDDDLAGVDVQHALGAARHDGRPRVDGDDLVAILGVEEQDLAPGRLRFRDRPLPGRSAADDDELDLPALDGDLGTERRPRRIRAVDDRERGQPLRRMALDDQPWPRRHLAGTDVGHAIDGRQAVATIAGQAERAASAGHLAGPQDGDGDGVAGLERDGSTVDDEPAVDRLIAHSAHPQALWVEERLWLQSCRPSPTDDLDLEAPAARPVGRGQLDRHVAQRDRPLDVVPVAARGDPADDGTVVPDGLVADDVRRVVGIGLDDERAQPPLRAAGGQLGLVGGAADELDDPGGGSG